MFLLSCIHLLDKLSGDRWCSVTATVSPILDRKREVGEVGSMKQGTRICVSRVNLLEILVFYEELLCH